MAKKKEMNRTSGTAKRKISQAEEIRYGMKTGKPLTGSASGVKSISLKQAGEALTQGIVTTRGGKLQFAPEGLAMALPVGKVLKARNALSAAGKIGQAGALDARLLAKAAGKQTARTGGSTINDVAMRNQSTSVFPRSSATKVRTAPNRILELQGQKRRASYTDMDRVNDFMSGYPTSRAEARAFGRAAAKEISKNSKTPKMNPQQAQDSYERVSDLIKGGQKVKFGAVNPLFKKTRGK
jgi:hypothetical protein